jgi:ribonuclease P protein component
MIQKTSRLPKDEFRAKGYGTISTPYFLLKTKKNTGDIMRIGVVAGKAVHKTAVKRNFWKRQAKTGLSSIIKKGIDILMVLSANVNKATKKQFQEELKKAIAKI